MKNSKPSLTKKETIKKFLLILASIIVFAVSVLFLEYGEISIKPLLIGLIFILPFMIVGAFIGFKNKQQINQNKTNKKVYLIYIILGMAAIIINGFLVTMGERGIYYYIQIGIGLMLLFYGIKEINNKK
jgi:peptidoglycan/LPS O-acetylase OafA/YrhL